MHAIAQRLIKIQSVALLAAAATFLLFYFMQFLIAIDEDRASTPNVIRIIDATMPKFEQTLFEEVLPPEPLDEPLPPLEQPQPRGPGINFDYTPIPRSTSAEPLTPETAIPLSSNIMVPLIRTTANYPARALARGIEGFVELSFTVNVLGEVEDPVVLNAEPEGIFEQAALQSIRRWKYAAAIENGEPVPTYDVRQRIVFQIEQ